MTTGFALFAILTEAITVTSKKYSSNSMNHANNSTQTYIDMISMKIFGLLRMPLEGDYDYFLDRKGFAVQVQKKKLFSPPIGDKHRGAHATMT
ncbi:MAG TPA: hypothetical protein DIC34_12020 [Treponema sp.]|nr:hypothetical protein [Treponema sp.]